MMLSTGFCISFFVFSGGLGVFFVMVGVQGFCFFVVVFIVFLSLWSQQPSETVNG